MSENNKGSKRGRSNNINNILHPTKLRLGQFLQFALKVMVGEERNQDL